MNREYYKPIDKIGFLMTIDTFEEHVEDGSITNDDGIGYWVKNGLASDDEVFGSYKIDASHVIWYNK